MTPSNILNAGFSPAAYRAANVDLTQMSDADAISHFILHGAKERRQFEQKELRAEHLRGDRDIVISLSYNYARSNIGLDAESIVRTLDVLAKIEGCAPFLLIGDSHSVAYHRLIVSGNRWFIPLHLCCPGGSAIGLPNDQSRSGYGAAIKRMVDGLSSRDIEIPLLLQFGQVDTEFASAFRRIRDAERQFNLERAISFNEESVRKYSSWLSYLSRRYKNITVLSIFPPCLSNDTWRQGYVNGHIAFLEELDLSDLHSKISELEIPDLSTRTSIHAHYNQLLKSACDNIGLAFAEGFFEYLSDRKVIDEKWIPFYRGADHHLEYQPVQAPTEAVLRRILCSGESETVRTRLQRYAAAPILDRARTSVFRVLGRLRDYRDRFRSKFFESRSGWS